MNSVSKIHTRFSNFDTDMRNIWQSYCLVEVITKEAHKSIKKGHIPPLSITTITGGSRNLSVDDTLGVVSRLKDKEQPRTTLLQMVALFEDYLSWLTSTVMLDDPSLLRSDAPSSEKEDAKIINVILDSADKAEIIERIVEEKVRGIFYGNPVDFFTKPKTKLRFQKYFSDRCQSQLDQYAEITARRNIIAHNSGRVDRKYIREVKNHGLRLNHVVPLPATYLQGSIKLLLCLAARATELVLIGHYQATAKGRLAERSASCDCLPLISNSV